jgi:hypothetical protein
LNNNNSARYICGAINDYPQGSYYDSSIPPYGATVIIPMQHELVSESSVACVISLQVNGSIVNAGGRVVTYELSPPSTCSNASRNDAPLDEYFPFLALIFGGVGFSKTRKKRQHQDFISL